MSAELLRRAAALMRERAEAAIACDPDTEKHWWTLEGLRDVLDEPGMSDAELTADTEHIASWHPAVALAVADLLDRAVSHWIPDPHGEEEDVACCCCPHQRDVVKLVRAYLGEDA